MKFIASVQNLHLNFSCHSLGCGQIPSACLPCCCTLYPSSWHRPWSSRFSLPFQGLETTAKPFSESLRRARLAKRHCRGWLLLLFTILLSLWPSKGLFSCPYRKPMELNVCIVNKPISRITCEEVVASQGRWWLSLDLWERTHNPLPSVCGALLGSTVAQVVPECFHPVGRDRGHIKSWRHYLRNWRRRKRKENRTLGGRRIEIVRNGRVQNNKFTADKSILESIWLNFLTGRSLPLCALCYSPCQRGH